jgi:fibronectin type 3 domain-containing protein
MNTLKIYFVLLFVFSLGSLYAQTGGVLSTQQGSSVLVKWFSNDIYYEEGTNLYRKEQDAATWTKLNDTPFKKGVVLPTATELAQEQDLSIAIDLAKSVDRSNFKGVVKLNIFLKSIQSNVFAKYMGIFYEDKTAEVGKKYLYRVTKIKNGAEQEIGVSTVLTVQNTPEAIQPPQDITMKAAESQVDFKWKLEGERFYAVNVYRSSSVKPTQEKLNDLPLLVNKVANQAGTMDYPAVFFSDTTIVKEVSYTYQLTALDFFGRESTQSAPFVAAIKDETPPPPPSKLDFKINNLEVNLSWKEQKVADLAGYYVYRSENDENNFQKVNSQLIPAGTTVYKDILTKSGGYYYQIAAVDRAGNENNTSSFFADVKDVIPPATPTGLTASADTGKITLRWSKNNEPDLKGYHIYKTIAGSESYVLLNAEAITVTEFTEELPRNAKNRFLYKIVASDSSYNKSEMTQAVGAQMPDAQAPDAPFIKSIQAKDRALVIDLIPNVESDLKGYEVYRAEQGENSNFVKVNKSLLDRNAKQFIDNEIKANISYFYYLTALDSAGNISPKSNMADGIAKIMESASVPTNLKANYEKAKNLIQISYQVSLSPEVLGVTIYRRAEAEEDFTPISGLIKQNNYEDKNIKKGETYYYEVRAYHQSGSVVKAEAVKIKVGE